MDDFGWMMLDGLCWMDDGWIFDGCWIDVGWMSDGCWVDGGMLD